MVEFKISTILIITCTYVHQTTLNYLFLIKIKLGKLYKHKNSKQQLVFFFTTDRQKLILQAESPNGKTSTRYLFMRWEIFLYNTYSPTANST